MLRLDNDRHAERVELFIKKVCNLRSEPLLELGSAREAVNYPRELRQTDNFAVARDICYMRPADKRQHMVLTQRIKLDVADDHHLIALRLEQRTVGDVFQAHPVTVAQVLHRLGGALGRIQKPLTLGVFADANEDFTVMAG